MMSKVDLSIRLPRLAKATGGWQLMGKHEAEGRCGADRARIGGRLLIGALASGAMAAAALNTAGQAEATCMSAGGWFSVGHGCTTSAPGDFAFAIGEGAEATATGGFNTAIAVGNFTSATASGQMNTAIGVGAGATAEAIGGYSNVALAIGDAATGGGDTQALMRAKGTYALAGSDPRKLADDVDRQVAVQNHNNTAISIGSGAQSTANGVFSTASAFGTMANAIASGARNTAFAFGTQASAQALGGKNNTAIAIGNPDIVNDGGGTPTPELRTSIKTSTPTQAVAGNVNVRDGGTAAALAGGTEEPSNNTAIAVGNGSVVRAGGGNNNYASAIGNRNIALALGGNRNRATVVGNDSRAGAGAPVKSDTSDQTRLSAAIKAAASNGNTATVVGNRSTAVAGPGKRNLASVIGNNSSARASGDGQRAVTVGNDKDTPSKEKENEKGDQK
jgi:hypothetical protein